MDNISDLGNIIKLWLDEKNTSGFWNISISNYNAFDVIDMTHIYEAINHHDNEVISIRITIPHDPEHMRVIGLSAGLELGTQMKSPPSDPNFFECLRSHINHAMIINMTDLYKKLRRGKNLKYRGIYAESSNIS